MIKSLFSNIFGKESPFTTSAKVIFSPFLFLLLISLVGINWADSILQKLDYYASNVFIRRDLRYQSLKEYSEQQCIETANLINPIDKKVEIKSYD